MPANGPVPVRKQASLFQDQQDQEPPEAPGCLLASATLTLFNEPSTEEDASVPLTTAQKKARSILESFENPFRMFLPVLEHHAHISQAAKFDPSSKIYEISNRWKLASQAQAQKDARDATKKKAAEPTAAQDSALDVLPKTEEEPEVAAQALSVRQQIALENAKKRERTTSDPRATEQKQEKKRPKTSKKPKDPEEAPEKDFTPFDYSKSDFKAFAGNNRSAPASQFDPNKQTLTGKKCLAAKKLKQTTGNKSMSFPTGKSDRGFRHNWPKR